MNKKSFAIKYACWRNLFLTTLLGFFITSFSIKTFAMPNVEAAFSSVTFQSANNNSLYLNKFKGKVVVLFFGYTHCPDICPTTLLDISRAINELGEDVDRVQPIFISVDYKRDTPQSLAQYTAYFNKHILGITSDKENIDEITKLFKTSYALLDHQSKNYLVEHSSNIYIIDENLIVQRIISNGLPYLEITKAIKSLL
tara:strand:- start:486 stop:1079 length:594 start_codon:yes stop_codon:yes gene_type:complete